MKANNICSKKRQKLITAGALIILSVAMLVLYKPAMLPAQTRQEEVAARGAKVMPFDLEQTTHVFQKLDDGGLQKVVVKDPSNKKQIALIQAHLKEESEKFRKGDFSDPAKIHGEDMPGLAQLKTGAAKNRCSLFGFAGWGPDSIHNKGPEAGDRAPSMVFSAALRPRRSRYTSLGTLLKFLPSREASCRTKRLFRYFMRMRSR